MKYERLFQPKRPYMVLSIYLNKQPSLVLCSNGHNTESQKKKNRKQRYIFKCLMGGSQSGRMGVKTVHVGYCDLMSFFYLPEFKRNNLLVPWVQKLSYASSHVNAQHINPLSFKGSTCCFYLQNQAELSFCLTCRHPVMFQCFYRATF